LYKLKNQINENTFFSFLEEISEIYIKARYFYEDPRFSIRYLFLKYFMISVSSKAVDNLMNVESFFDKDI